MKYSNIAVLIFMIFTISAISESNCASAQSMSFNQGLKDTLRENQILYNGRTWDNLYYMVKGDQFLFSAKFLPATVTMRGKLFRNVSLRYDIFNDEILIPIPAGGVLQLNKEMVDSFTIFFQERTFRFIRVHEDSLNEINGYMNVLYKGKSTLYVKYNKKIDRMADEGKYDKFYQISRIYLLKDGLSRQVKNKSDLIKILNEDKGLIKNYIRKNKLIITEKDPESFVPVISYFDSIR